MNMVEARSSVLCTEGNGGRLPDSLLVLDTNRSTSRRVNFGQSASHQRPTTGSSQHLSVKGSQGQNLPARQGPQRLVTTPEKMQSTSSLRNSSRLRPPQNGTAKVAAEAQRKPSSAFTFARVHDAGGAQGSLGSEPDYWAYTSPPSTSTAQRVFSFDSKRDGARFASDSEGQGQMIVRRKISSIERLFGTDTSTVNDKQEPGETVAFCRGADAFDEALQEDKADQLRDCPDWQDPYPEVGEQGVNDMAGGLWRKQTARPSTSYPICARTARERCAYTTSDDWAIFALHSQYVRPLRDREWVPGEPCIIRKDSFELPPGARRFSESTSGLPATAFNSFIFPNPPRQSLMHQRGICGSPGLGIPSVCLRKGGGRQGGRRRDATLTQRQLLDLERMLWFDPEPRLERPFRLYADSKACLKGPINDIGHIMRSGW